MGKKNKKKSCKSQATAKKPNSGKDSVRCTHEADNTPLPENPKVDQLKDVPKTDEKDSKANAPVPSDKSTKMADNGTTKDSEDLRVKDQKKDEEAELELMPKQNCAKHSKEIHDLQMKLTNQKEEIKALNAKNDELKTSSKEMQMKLTNQKEEIKVLNAKMDELKTRIMDKDATIDELRLKEEEIIRNFQDRRAELDQQISRYKSKADQLNVDLSKSISERDSYKTRFSQLAGSKLMYRNEGITDLSDNNRPDKLAERYNELYDNQWTDAFEEINEANNDEKETIDKLLTMLKDCVQLCTNTADRQKVRIQEFFKKEIILLNRTQDDVSTCNGNLDTESNEIAENDMKNLTDIRKSYGKACLTELQKIFYEKYPHHITKNRQVTSYIESSLEICWFAAIQEPPLSFDWDFEHDSDIQSGLVKIYTVRGNKVDYVVWPTLKLSGNGSLLVKGVVQAINEKK